MNWEAKDAEALHQVFGVTEFTAEQLWALTKFAKRVRLRARNNGAYNNLCNRMFPYARFRQVPKVNSKGETYDGLSITVNGQTVSPDNEAEAA